MMKITPHSRVQRLAAALVVSLPAAGINPGVLADKMLRAVTAVAGLVTLRGRLKWLGRQPEPRPAPAMGAD